MSGYAVFFNNKNKTYRLPVNPEQIEISSVLAIEKYEILKLGQIAVPSHLELKKYSFETEFPKYSKNYPPHYIETPKEFHGSDYYISLFSRLQRNLVPVRFIAGIILNDNKKIAIDEGEVDFDKSINTLVLIEELIITEKSGEEGDKYVKFELLEYREFSKKIADELIYTKDVASGTTKVKKYKAPSTEAVNKKSQGFYVVKSGDSLWTIAKSQYGDGSKCNIIYNANKDKIKNPAMLSVGWKLKIPSESEFAKYSAPLPTTKPATETKVQKTNANSTGYELAKANIAGFVGGVTPGGHSHSTSRGKF